MTVPEERAAVARAALARAELRTGAPLLTRERPALPVPAELLPLLPTGLRRGGVTVVTGSTSLLLALVAAACAGGAWAAAAGHPTLGLLAAAQAGVALDRFALVPDPGPDAARVVAALVDGIDVVVVGPQALLTDADRNRLTARARERGAVLLAGAPWPGAAAVLTAVPGRWTGTGTGDGRLRTHELQVTRTGRGGAGAPARVDLVLPLSTPDRDRSAAGRLPERAGGRAPAPATVPPNPARLVG